MRKQRKTGQTKLADRWWPSNDRIL